MLSPAVERMLEEIIAPLERGEYKQRFTVLMVTLLALHAQRKIRCAWHRAAAKARIVLSHSTCTIAMFDPSFLCFNRHALQAQQKMLFAWRRAYARARIVLSQGAVAAGGTSGGAWLRRRLLRRRGDAEQTDDGAWMSSRLREVIMGELIWMLDHLQLFLSTILYTQMSG